MTTITGVIKEADGTLKEGTEIRFELATPSAQSDGDVFTGSAITASAANGTFSISVAPGKYDIWIDGHKVKNDKTIADAQSHNINDLL